MTPNRRRTTRWALITLTVVAVAGVAALVRNERDIRPYVAEQARFIRYRTGDDPVLRGLASGRIKAGDPVEDLIAAHPPGRVVRHTSYVTLSYGVGKDGLSFEGLTVIARDGKLVFAAGWSCTYLDQFFKDPSLDAQAYSQSYDAEMDRLFAARHAARLAAAGFGATFLPNDIPTAPPGTEN